MEQTYKIIEILPLREGDTQNGHYKNQEVIIQSTDMVQYPDRYLLTLRGEKVEMLSGIEVGSLVNARWSANVRKYTKDGKDYYSQELRCWKIGLADTSNKEEEVKPF